MQYEEEENDILTQKMHIELQDELQQLFDQIISLVQDSSPSDIRLAKGYLRLCNIILDTFEKADSLPWEPVKEKDNEIYT